MNLFVHSRIVYRVVEIEEFEFDGKVFAVSDGYDRFTFNDKVAVFVVGKFAAYRVVFALARKREFKLLDKV